MKKVLSILLVVSMLLSFAGCGTQTVTKGDLTLKIKGNGSKKLKLTVSDRIEAYTERNVVVQEMDEFKIDISEKTKDKTVTYTVKSKEGAGSISGYIEYVNDGTNVGLISFLLTVDEKGKVSCSNLAIGNDEKYQAKANDDGYEISDFEGETKSIRIKNGNGTWAVGTCDKLVEVVDTVVTEEYTEVTITAKSEGEGSIQIFNRKDQVQFYFDLKVTTQESGTFLLSILGAQKSEFSSADDKELIEKREEAKENAKEVIEDIYIPDWAYVASLFKYNNKNVKNNTTGGTPDSVDATLESTDALYDYVVSKDINFNEKVKEFSQLGVGIKEETLKLNDYEITYIYVETGFSVAIWKFGDYVSVLTVMEPNTEVECKQAVLDFFG